MKVIRQIGLNVFSQWSAFIVQGTIGILLVPFLINSLGKDAYGVVILLGVVVGLSQIAELGLRGALGRHLSEALTLGDVDLFNTLTSTATAIWLVIAFMLGLLCSAYAGSIVDFLNVSEELRGTTVLLLATFGSASIVVSFIQPVFSSVLSSLNRFDIESQLQVFISVFSGVLLFLIIPFYENGLLVWAIITISGQIILLIIKAYVTFRLFPRLQIRPLLFSFSCIRKLFSLSGYMFFLQLTNALSVKSDPIILSKYLGPVSLAIYNPGLVLTSKIQPLVNILSNQLFPITTRFHTKGDGDSMVKVLFWGTRASSLFAIIAYLPLSLLSEEISMVWLKDSLGEDYKYAGFVILLWSIARFFEGLSGSQWPVLLGKDKIRFLVITQFPLAIANLAASLYLVLTTDLGVVGVLVPTVLASLMRRVMTTIYVARICDVRVLEYLQRGYGRAVLVLIGSLPFILVIKIVIPVVDLIDLLLVISLSLGVVLLLAFLIGLSKFERNSFYKSITNKLKVT